MIDAMRNILIYFMAALILVVIAYGTVRLAQELPDALGRYLSEHQQQSECLTGLGVVEYKSSITSFAFNPENHP